LGINLGQHSLGKKIAEPGTCRQAISRGDSPPHAPAPAHAHARSPHRRLEQEHERRDRLTRRPNHEARPAGQKTKATQRRDGTEPFYIREGEEIKAAAEEYNSGDEQAGRGPSRARPGREHEKNDGVDEVIQNGGFPDCGCLVTLERSFQSVRTECSERDREQAERGCEAKDGDVHSRKLE